MQSIKKLDIRWGQLLGGTVHCLGQGANGAGVLKEGEKVGHEDDQQQEDEYDPGPLREPLAVRTPSCWRPG